MVEAGKAQTEMVCLSCGSPIGPQAAFCHWCGSPVPQTGEPPSFWRRVITGGIALLFLGLAALFFFAAAIDDSEDDIAWRVFLVIGGAFTLISASFAIATVIPFGRTRRVLVGLGVGFIGFVFFGILAITGQDDPAGLRVALPIVAAFVYFGYRIAR